MPGRDSLASGAGGSGASPWCSMSTSSLRSAESFATNGEALARGAQPAGAALSYRSMSDPFPMPEASGAIAAHRPVFVASAAASCANSGFAIVRVRDRRAGAVILSTGRLSRS